MRPSEEARPGAEHRDAEEHFRFGENWESFARTVDQGHIAEAVRGLVKLAPPELIAGKSFLDIGCGSGLSMLAALRLGAERVHGVDIDVTSVATARALLSRHAPGGNWTVDERTVFDLDPAQQQFDIVHSWGVLHHTGAMWQALDAAAAMVAAKGLLIVALYHRTPLCGLWWLEKRVYAFSPKPVQLALRGVYKAAFVGAQLARARNPRRYIADYARYRGMDWHHDVHDWLGGFPYESTGKAEVEQRLRSLGFALVLTNEVHPPALGLFGTGCDEYVASRLGSGGDAGRAALA